MQYKMVFTDKNLNRYSLLMTFLNFSQQFEGLILF